MDQKLFRDYFFQYGKTALCVIFALVLLTVAVLELLPTKNLGVQVKETICVSSSKIYADGSLYDTEIRGVIQNKKNEQLTVESIAVVISDGKTKQKKTIEAVTIHPNADYEIVARFQDATDFDTVHEVWVSVGGEETRLANRSASAFPVSGIAIACLVLLIPIGFLTVRSIQGCYYLAQEGKYRR